MSIPWTGAKKIAIVPAFKTAYDQQPPNDWAEQVTRRVFYDPIGPSGEDQSLQNYIRTTSSGQAHLEGKVFPAVWSADDDTVGKAIMSLPPEHGFTHILVVLPHSFGQHRGGFALWDMAPKNGITAWARVAMFEDPNLTSRQSVGVWAMEVLHSITELGDLYNVQPNMGSFDVMSNAYSASHPSIHTKQIFGWLIAPVIKNHLSGNKNYSLHAVGLPQPTPPPRVTAIRVQARTSGNHFIIEARRRLDQYEEGSGINESGIPSEGVIVYEVQSSTKVYLRTPTALKVNQLYSNQVEGFSVKVTEDIIGGFKVNVRILPDESCPQRLEQIELMREMLKEETDPNRRKQLLQAIGDLVEKAKHFGCM